MRRVLLMLIAPATAFAIDTATFDDAATEARYRALIAEIRCLVCQNQSLADSNAPLAVDLREEVRAQIARGASDDEVVSYLTARYGDFVLYKPRFTAVTAVLWLAPLLLLLIGAGLAWRALAGPGAAERVHDDAERTRIRRLLDDRNER
ncbi:MAG: cytochrome c-type biogenesis protein [Gammaproteobacteria bacterium]